MFQPPDVGPLTALPRRTRSIYIREADRKPLTEFLNECRRSQALACSSASTWRQGVPVSIAESASQVDPLYFEANVYSALFLIAPRKIEFVLRSVSGLLIRRV